MKDWVKLLIKNVEEKEKHEIYRELVDKFDFKYGTYLESVVVDLIGSVLADLPESVFKKLSEMKNLYICPGSDSRGTVFNLKLNRDIKAGETITILAITPEYLFDDFLELRGVVAHELAHIFAGHTQASQEIEIEADEIASSWGFEREIKASRGIYDDNE